MNYCWAMPCPETERFLHVRTQSRPLGQRSIRSSQPTIKFACMIGAVGVRKRLTRSSPQMAVGTIPGHPKRHREGDDCCGHNEMVDRRKPMKQASIPTCLFVDIGGVLLTDGWNHHFRERAAAHFKLDWVAMEERHQINFAVYEEGKMTLEEYLGRVVFYQQRVFTQAEFRNFMFAQSEPYSEMIALIAKLKIQHRLKIAVVSNEARELNAYRIEKFKLGAFIDFFISSCFVHTRKPDIVIFRLAVDIAHVPVEQIVYIENTAMFVEIAQGLGIRSILHTDYKSTRAQMSVFGLPDIETTNHETD